MKGSNEEPTSLSTSTSPPRTWAHQLHNPSTPSTQVAEATSAGSRADYSCYTIRKKDKILAVVIETKMDKSSQDALAQVYPFT